MIVKPEVIYRVRTRNKWLDEVKNYQSAGMRGKPITDIAIKVTKGTCKYRVSPLNKTFYDYQYDTQTSNGQDGYASSFGKSIDYLQIGLYSKDSESFNGMTRM